MIKKAKYAYLHAQFLIIDGGKAGRVMPLS